MAELGLGAALAPRRGRRPRDPPGLRRAEPPGEPAAHVHARGDALLQLREVRTLETSAPGVVRGVFTRKLTSGNSK